MSGNPGVGDALPDIALETPDGGTVKPSDFAGRKLVVFFYPKDDTPGCTIEANEFNALAQAFAAQDAVVIGVSKDDRYMGNVAPRNLYSWEGVTTDVNGRLCQGWLARLQKALI